MWMRNDQRHNALSNDEKLYAARAYYVETMGDMLRNLSGVGYINGASEFLCAVWDGKHDAVLSDHLRVLNRATRVHNRTQALMYLRGYNARFDSENPFETTRYVATGGASWTHGYLMRYSSCTREDELNNRRHLGAHKPKTRYTYDEDGEIVCSDPRGHHWVVSDEDENYCYCNDCGCCEY